MMQISRVIRPGCLLLAVSLLLVSVTSHAGAPEGRYTITTDTVYDNLTGRRWQRNVDSSSLGIRTYWDAETYCSMLTLDGVGHYVWRLPTIKELQSIVDVRAWNPAIDTSAFPNTPANRFWSSTGDAQNPTGLKFFVNFSDGSISSFSLTYAIYVRCVKLN